ncbi:MAG TPA: hypothetical protein VLB69_02905 [Rudaea sp.]|nr:hypothetical protein [Rudaea sp.]
MLLAAFALASCGGGGGGSQSAFTPTPSDTIEISAAATSIPTNYFTTLTVTVKKADGSAENDGVAINASLSPSTIGTVSGKAGTAAGATASNTLSGGKTTFNFTSSNQAGTASITISVPSGTNGSTTAATKSIAITVTPGNGQDPRLQLSATSTTLPLNPYSIGESQKDPFPGNFVGSPYISEVTVTWRHSNGQLVTGTSCVNVSVAPVTIIQFSQLIGGGGSSGCTIPQPSDGDLFHNLEGSGPVAVTGGVGTIFVHSSQVAGTGVLSVTGIDPDNNQTISSQLTFTVAGGATGVPASISVSSSGPAYVSDSGGQSAIITARVTDGSNALIGDPDGFNNVLFEIVGSTDARLSGVNAAGQTVTGTSISVATHSGIAAVTFLAGSQQGPVQVKASADRGDNNVDNGIQDPVSASTTVVVSDGKLFSLKITNPAIDANLLPVIDSASSSGSTTPTPVYSVPVTVLATDRQGNPVLPGTRIVFGLIDAPVFGFPDVGSGTFELSGSDGNPQEGGSLFTAPTGAFTTAGGGAGPGDALVVFGKETTGDADLESARTVQHINNAGSLNVTQAFNLNDTTGVSVDTGSNIPYVIGRATAGNIDAQAFTGVDADSVPNGVASVTMRYPQSRIGQSAVIWAQSTGTNQTNGAAKTVADAIRTRYLGVGPATLTATPENIFGNTTQTVTVCLNDAVGSPIPGAIISFSFSGLAPATGTVNGKTSGALGATGASGCIDTTVITAGVLPGSEPTIVFTTGGLSATVTISVGTAILTAKPTFVNTGAGSTPGTINVALLLTDGSGSPVPSATITGACTTSGGSLSVNSPWITNANGGATATITVSGYCVATAPAPSGLCTYTYTNGTVTTSATTTVQGQVVGQFSPSCVP